MNWPLPPTLEDAALEKKLFPPPPPPSANPRPQPDYAALHKELRSPNVTLQLLWEEYKQEYPAGYSYSRFSELYGAWSRRLDLVLRQDHGARDKLFVDHAGQTVPVIDRLRNPQLATGCSSSTSRRTTLPLKGVFCQIGPVEVADKNAVHQIGFWVGGASSHTPHPCSRPADVLRCPDFRCFRAGLH